MLTHHVKRINPTVVPRPPTVVPRPKNNVFPPNFNETEGCILALCGSSTLARCVAGGFRMTDTARRLSSLLLLFVFATGPLLAA